MKKIIFLLSIMLLMLNSCENSGEVILPGSTGKTHNILLIQDNNSWKGAVGDSIRKYFAEEYPDLPQAEPLFGLQQASPELYNGIYKIARNVVIVKKGDKPGIRFYKNRYAEPQLITIVEGKDNEQLKELISKHSKEIIDKYKISEIKNLQSRHRKSLRNNEDIEKELKVSIDIPDFFNLVDHQNKFFWFRRDLKNGEQDILIYEVPLKDSLDLSGENIIKYRDSICKKYIPGPSDGSYMKTATGISPSQNVVTINGHKAIETRGLWNMQDDFMGGPFINYSIIDKKNKRMVVVEGFIYNPGENKRDYLIQLEAILKTTKILE